MSAELPAIYDQYMLYHQSFRQDFLIHCVEVVSVERTPKVLTVDEFATLWNHWAEIGTQPEWCRRFERGYRASIQPFSNSIREALIRADTQLDDQLATAA
jgi:hypothetical protein